MKPSILGGLFAAAILSAPAVAADLPVKARPLPPVAAVYSWTGCYIGVSGGGLWADKSWVDTGRLAGTERARHTASGGMIGGQIGCDYQAGRWVFGIEGSYHWTDARATSGDLVFPTLLNNTTDVRGLGTVTGRVGYTVFDQALVYVRGGVAFERDRYRVDSLFLNATLGTATEDRVGGLIGVGLEYMFTRNLSAFVEYDYIDMGRRDVSFAAAVAPGTYTTYSIRERKDVVKAGLNYRFNWAEPVVARY